MKNSLFIIPLLLLAGCASQSHHITPSVAPVRQSVTQAKQSNEAARKLATKAAASISNGAKIADALAALASPADKLQFMKLQVDLTDAQKELQQTQDQLTATASTLGDTLVKADTLEKQVDQQGKDLDTVTQKEAGDQKQIAKDGVTIKKQGHEVLLYKGGLIIAILLGLAYLLFSLGFITKIVGLALTVVMPWGYVILAAAAVALPALLYGILWKLLP